MTGGQQFDRSQGKAAEVAFVEFDCVQQVLAEMDFPALKQGQYFAAGPLADFDVDVGITLCIAKQKLRQNTFDVLRRAGDFQDTSVPMPEQLSLLLDGAGAIEKQRQPATICSPSPVRSSRRPTRSKRRRPSSRSRSMICRDNAGWAIRSRSAAFETVPSSATVTNVRACRRFMSAYSNQALESRVFIYWTHIVSGGKFPPLHRLVPSS